jgi:hypothetical protein
VLDLNDGINFTKVRGSFGFTPGPPTLQRASRSRRYGGARTVGVTHDNGSVSWKVFVKGTTPQIATQNSEALLATVENAALDRYLEWTPFGGQASYLSIAGPGTWAAEWDPMRWSQTFSLSVTITFPVMPLVRWAPCPIGDDFKTLGVLSDYTFDAGTSSDVTQVGLLAPSGITTFERRARHTVRGYKWLEGQVTLDFSTGTTITGYKAGVLLRATDANNYVEVYVDDNGTNSRLRIDVVISGTRTNRATTNLAARLSASTEYWVRGRIEGNTAIAEFFTTAPVPASVPATTNNYTFLTVGDAPLSSVAGYSGFSWIPQQSAASINNFDWRLVYNNRPTPAAIVPSDPIPGAAPALVDVTLTPVGGATPPSFALIGWTPHPITPIAGIAPFGVFSCDTDLTDTANLTRTADANALDGFSLQDTSVSGAETYITSRLIDPSALTADAFTASEISLEVWLRAALTNTIVTPTFVISARSFDGTVFGAERFTNEWGNAGRVLLSPTGTFYQMYRLGTIDVPANSLARRTLKLWLAARTGAGSTGSLFLDYLVVLPVRSRALSPSGKHLDSTYPSFVGSTAATAKTIRSDLSALVASAATAGHAGMADHGLGGSLIEPPPGAVDWIVKLSSQVPDDPIPTAVHEQTVFNVSVELDVTPRSFMLRNT